jgi:hypothetical protein
MVRCLYSEIANLIQARSNCSASGNIEWFEKHTDAIDALVAEHMPSGSGFDNGTQLDLILSHVDKLVFKVSFHHMNEVGYYDGWTHHTVTVTPSFIGGFNLRVSGRNLNDIKGYIGDTFAESLSVEVGA